MEVIMTTGNDFSGLFAPVYVCSEHGETWHVEFATEIDSVNDEVYEHHICSLCRRDVVPLLHDGHTVLHPLTNDEAYWETWSKEEDDEEYDYAPCAVCGGEFWDGGTSCTCEDDEELQ
jgi:hypothetical protein